MSTETVRLSFIDRHIQIFTATNTYKLRKINEQILVQQKNSNEHLSDLKRQMDEANDINKQILANQLKAEEYKETQKYYKALSFHLFETIDLISKIEDPMVLNYVFTHYYDKIKENIMEANDHLDEIGDKTFNKQALDKLDSIKTAAASKHAEFITNILSKIDDYLANFKNKETRFAAIKKPVFTKELINGKKVNILRTFGIVILGIITFFLLLSFFLLLVADTGVMALFPLIITAPFAIPFTILLIKEIKWRKYFNKFTTDQLQKEQEFEKNKLELERQYESTILNEKEALLNHPFHAAMIEINKNHPTFDKSLSGIIELGTTFEKKWGL